MSHHPTVDTISARRHCEGWSVGDMAVKRHSRRLWVESGQLVKTNVRLVSEPVYSRGSTFSKMDELPGKAVDPRTSALGADHRLPA
jgi:hypothetical protein